ISPRQPSGKNIIRWLLKKEQMVVSAIASTPHVYPGPLTSVSFSLCETFSEEFSKRCNAYMVRGIALAKMPDKQCAYRASKGRLSQRLGQ
ncbi:hypothetical protein, partial [Shigella dysenteriae]|uniref:hypothetical protein n=1 Tax=Shigella dysenteriae TaxID=622 RepID=UPI0019D41817